MSRQSTHRSADDTTSMRSVSIGNAPDEVKPSNLIKALKILGIAAIVAFFSSFYCWSFWDVSGNMSNVEIGIINNDRGATVDDKAMNLGDDITEAILENDRAKWVELDSSAMDNGFENSGYLMVFEIPEDFTERVVSGKDGIPEVAELEVYKNVRHNYIFSQFAMTVESAVKTSIDEQIISSYVEGAYTGLYDARDGLDSAADGAGKLADGSNELEDGLSNAVEGSRAAASGAAKLTNGAQDLSDGADKVDGGANALAAGGAKLADGTGSLVDGADSLAAGTKKLADSTEALPSKTKQLKEGIDTATAGLSAASEGISKLQSASNSVTEGLETLSGNLSEGEEGLSSGAETLSGLATKLDNASGSADQLKTGAEGAKKYYAAALAAMQAGGSYGGKTAQEWKALGDGTLDQVSAGAGSASEQLTSASKGVAGAASQIKAAASGLGDAVDAIGSTDQEGKTLAYGSGQVTAGLKTLNAKIDDANDGMGKLQAGASKLASSSKTLATSIQRIDKGAQSLASGATKVDDGAASVASGAKELATGTGTLANGAVKVANGAEQLANKLPALTDGLESAEKGADKLADGSDTLQTSLTEGADTMSEALHASAEAMGEYVSAPLETEQNLYGNLDSYGQGFSPFFMTTALWIGALLLFFVVEPLAPKKQHAGRLRTVIGRLPMYAGVCALEAAGVVAVAFATGVADAHHPSVLVFYLYALGVSLCFMLIMQFLNLAFGLVGKGIAIVILIFQLAGSGGTIPIELGQKFLSVINPWLPYTYAIDGFREVITYCNIGIIGADLMVLATMGFICLALSLACWRIAERHRDQEAREYIARHTAPSSSKGAKSTKPARAGLFSM